VQVQVAVVVGGVGLRPGAGEQLVELREHVVPGGRDRDGAHEVGGLAGADGVGGGEPRGTRCGEPLVVTAHELGRPGGILSIGVGQVDGQLDGVGPVAVVIHLTPAPVGTVPGLTGYASRLMLGNV
jgi:hypothetical protein